MTFLIESTQTYRVENMEEADILEKRLRENKLVEVKSFTKKQKSFVDKEKDDKGKLISSELISYVLCKAQLVVNSEKYPVSDVNLCLETGYEKKVIDNI